MNVFRNYAQYYDLFYETKDYQAECDFVEEVFSRYADAKVKSISDWGCGTGKHAHVLSARGYTVVGIDQSREMIDIAKATPIPDSSHVVFIQGTAADTVLPEPSDAAISMFAVVGYQCSNDDLLAMFLNIRRNLKNGGLFFFDCWYGTAVLSQKPSERAGTFSRGEERVLRIVRPTLDAIAQTVSVAYHILITEGDRVVQEVKENHVMRFFFPQELKLALKQAGFELLKLGPAYDLNAVPSEKTWNICVVARAIE